MPKDLVHRSAFEAKGETLTRVLAQQSGDVGAEAKAWLAELEATRNAASADKRDAREEETLRIAKDALSSAKEANRIATEDLALALASAKAAESQAASAREQAALAREQAKWARWAAIIAAVAAIAATSIPLNELIAWLQK